MKNGETIEIDGLQLNVVNKIGEGGMGDVWLLNLINRNTNRNVYLIGKIIKNENLQVLDLDNNNKRLAKFKNECRISLLLEPNPNVAVTLAVGSVENADYIILMEYVPGINLYKWIIENRLELLKLKNSSIDDEKNKFLDIILSIAIQVTNSIYHLHKHNTAHRDLKTENLILKQNTEYNKQSNIEDLDPSLTVIKIVDLGLAKMHFLTEGTSAHSEEYNNLIQNPTSLGWCTPFYAPPEQIGIGDAGQIDTRLYDIFSYGIILCELFSVGYRPFDTIGSNIHTIMKQLNSNQISIDNIKKSYETQLQSFISNHLSNCPTILIEIIKCLLQFFPNNRFEKWLQNNSESYSHIFFHNLSDKLKEVYLEITKKEFKVVDDIFPLSQSYLLYDSRGSSLSKLGFKDDALGVIEKAISMNHKDALSHIGKFLVLAKAEEYDEALKITKAVLTKDPQNIMALNGKASILFKLEKYIESLDAYKESIKIDPNQILTLSTIGICLQRLGQHNEAILEFDKALKIDPDYFIALDSKWISLDILGGRGEPEKYVQAIDVFDRLLGINSNDKQILFNKGIILVKLANRGDAEKYKEAIDVYGKYLKIDSKNKDVWINQGFCYSKSGNLDLAEYCFDRALLVDKYYWKALYNKGIILRRRNRFHCAMKYFDDAINLNMFVPEIWYEKGICHRELRQLKEAISCTKFCINLIYHKMKKQDTDKNTTLHDL